MTTYEDEAFPGYRFEIGTVTEFSFAFEAIEALVSSRGHVSPKSLHKYLPEAQVIAAARHRDEIVAVCILKGVRPSYNASIAGKSKYSLRPDTPELGYAATHPQHEKRGLGSRLTQEVLKRAAGDVFATVRMTNSGEQRNLERLGFRREREHWKGDGQYNVGLWVRKKL